VAQVQLYPDSGKDTGIALQLATLPGKRWRAQLIRGDDTLTLDLERIGRTLLFRLAAPGWDPAGDGKPLLTQLSGLGRVVDGRLQLERLEASLGAGQLRGSLRLERMHAWHIEGAFTLEQITLGPLLARAGLPLLDGQGSGTLYLSGDDSELTNLVRTATLSGRLEIGAGKLLGLDLATPAQRLTVGEYAGGYTAFDGLQLALERRTPGDWLVTLESLRAAGLSGQGLLRVSGGILLDGTIKVRLGAIGSPSVPLLIAGTAMAPQVRLAPEALLSATPASEPGPFSPSPALEAMPAMGVTSLDLLVPRPGAAAAGAPVAVPTIGTKPTPAAQASVTPVPVTRQGAQRSLGWSDQRWSDSRRKPLVDSPPAAPKEPRKEATRPWILDYQ
jgi:hypothetical protein